MFKITLPPGILLLTITAIALILLPLTILACGIEEATERPTREPRDTSTEAPDEREEEPTAGRTDEPTSAPMPSEVPTDTPAEPSPTVAAAATETPSAPVPTATRPAPTATRPAPAPTAILATPAPTAVRATPPPQPPPTPARYSSVEEYAAVNAGGPGAVYVGDLRQLAGRAPTADLGDRNGNVTLDALQRHSWIYESDYYQSLLEKAKLTNPTEVTSSGERIEILFSCINRALNTCKLLQNYFAPNVEWRTGGQVRFEFSSFPELGVAGPDVLNLLKDGTLDASVVYGGYVSGEIPAVDIQSLWGIFSTVEESFHGTAAVVADLEPLVEEHTGGGRVISRNWYSGNDQFLFCNDAIESARDFQGKRTRSHSASLSDWINGMGGSAQFVAFAEVYTALERGTLHCGITGADPGYGQRWYEVASYMMGPLYSTPAHGNVINARLWNSLPADIQQIILEEGAKLELEALRLAPAQNEVGLTRLQDAGRRHIPFSSELQRLSRQAVVDRVIPAWVNRVGDTRDSIITETFNNKVGPIVGMRIESDGSVTDTGVRSRPTTGTGTTQPTPAPSPTPAPTPAPTPTPAPPPTPARYASVEEYAAVIAGGPGAIYVGDLTQLAGPAPETDLGDINGNVPLDALQQHSWIYESYYYQELVEKANFTNPTSLTSQGERIRIQFACVNKVLLPCKLFEAYFAPNVFGRTNGQMRFETSSFSELGLPGPETLTLVADGTLPAATIYHGHLSEEFPAFGIQDRVGIYSTAEEAYLGSAAIVGDLDRMVAANAGAATIFSHNWYAGNDKFLFCREALPIANDFRSKVMGTPSVELYLWLSDMGVEAELVAFSEVYTELERGRYVCGIAVADDALRARWFEVTDYMMGPLYSFPATSNAINSNTWNNLPTDIQQIILEEGARLELEALRLVGAQNVSGIQNQIDAGMQYVPFSAELRMASRNAGINSLTRWAYRVGDTSHPIITETFNNRLGPIVGARINRDTSVTVLR